MDPLTSRFRFLALFFVGLLSGCGANLPRTLKAPLSQGQLNAGQFLEGALTDADGKTEDLSGLRDRPLVLMLAGEFCATCIHEVGVFRNRISANVLGHQIRFRTLLVANDSVGSRLWRQNHQVPWPVGYQPGDALFRSWCPERTTPCLIVQVPEKGVVLRKTGSVPIAELEALTGAWKEPTE